LSKKQLYFATLSVFRQYVNAFYSSLPNNNDNKIIIKGDFNNLCNATFKYYNRISLIHTWRSSRSRSPYREFSDFNGGKGVVLSDFGGEGGGDCKVAVVLESSDNIYQIITL